MSFFNKKEDVIKIELTPHGRKLLSTGELKPEYYAFFDDDILYDSSRAGFSESNTESKARIITDTPSIKPQTTHRGVDTELFSSLSLDKNDAMSYAIGTNNYTDEEGAAWEAFLLKGEADTFSFNYITTTNENVKIPQVNCFLNYTMSVSNVKDGNLPISEYIDYGEDTIADDGSYIKIKEQELLIYLSEKNGFNTSESYTVDIFKFEHDKTEFKKLKFLSTKLEENYVEDDMLQLQQSISETGLRAQAEEFADEDTVETYFDIFLDDEVSRTKICEGIKFLSSQDIYTDLQDYDCIEILSRSAALTEEDLLEVNIYNTGNENLEACEDE